MDKYEYKVHSQEIVNLIEEQKYAEAVKIADKIDWRRVKSSTMLLTISALYRVNKRNEDSRDILLLAYERYPTNRSVVYSLCELSIELDDVVAAYEFYKQFVKLAPEDSGVYTLRYRILEAQEASLEERIAILEDLKAKDYQEEWVYELAYLYHRAGLATKCVEVCDEIILWIGDGPFVMKAMELKQLHVPLTDDQQAKYNFMLRNAGANYSASGYDQDYDDSQADGNYDENYDNNYDENYADDNNSEYNGEYDSNYDENGNYIGDENYNETYDESYDSNYDENGNYIGDESYNESYDGSFNENFDESFGEAYDSNYDENGNYIGDDEAYNENYDSNYDENGNYIGDEFYQEQSYDEYGNPIADEEPMQEEQTPPHRNDVDMSQYNTINLQKVVAESMKELFPDDDVFAEEREKLNSGELYETNVHDINAENLGNAENNATEGDTIIYGKFGEASAKPVNGIENEINKNETNISSDTDSMPCHESESLMPSQETESLMPSHESESLMTGQMKIDDVLAEWERIKVDNAKRHEEEIRNQIFSQTGQMLADFDTSVNNDIMAKLDDSNKASLKNGKATQPELDENEDAFDTSFNAAPATQETQELDTVNDDNINTDTVNENTANIATITTEETQELEINEAQINEPEIDKAQNAMAVATSNDIVEDLGEIEELEEITQEPIQESIQETAAQTYEESEPEYESEYESQYESEEMSELEKAVASELGGTTQNLPYETINEMAQASILENSILEGSVLEGTVFETGDDVFAEDFGEGYKEISYEENQFDQNQKFEQIQMETASDEVSDIEVHDTANLDSIEKEISKESVGKVIRELDPDETQDIAEMAKEDALKTQEIKMNTADLSVLSEKIVETTNKEATGAKREEVRNFTADEQELFENFAVTKKIKKQIINALDNMSLAAYTGNVIITGDAGLDTMRMAKNLIKEYQAQDPNFSGKIAKITGEKINDRNIKDIFDKLDNGGIIIEKANGMSEEKLYEMATLLNQENLGIIVIFEDTKKEISKLLEKQAMIADYFNIRIDLMEMDNNALVAYAKNYALALEYAIDELGTLALYTRIANMQSGNHVVTKDEVRDVIDEAIYKSKKSKIKNFVDVLFSRRYDSEDMIVLKERDFI